jgi:hypothetical protein
MRLAQAALIVLPVILAGCLSGRRADDSSLAARRIPDAGAAEVVRIDVAVIERPAGDHYLNHGLWDLADEQAVDLEHKSALDDNGFRVGVIGGLLPADLLALLSSERSCSEPHRIQLFAGASTSLPIGPRHTHCSFTLFPGGRTIPVDLHDATCSFEVVPALADRGRTTLRFTPVVKHGGDRREPRAIRDPSGEHRWNLEMQASTESYKAMSWEVTLSPEEYVVIGTRIGGDDTLGESFFLDTDSTRPKQRLFVIRTGRASPDAAPDEIPGDKTAPLALQAGWRSARGARPADNAEVFP